MKGALELAELLADDRSWEQQQAEWALAFAWHRWRVSSCVEFNGAHDMRLHRDDVGGTIELDCAYGCGATMDDFYPDGWDLTLFDLPVTIQVEVIHYRATPDHGDEYDVNIGLEPRNT